MSVNVCPDDIFWIAEPFTTRLGMVMHHFEPDCLSKRLVCCLKIKVTVKYNVIKLWLFNMLSELLILFRLDLIWWYIIIRWIALWKDWIALLWSRSRSQKRFRIPVNVHLNDISSATEPSVTKLGWWCNIMGQSIMQEDWFAVFKFRVTVRAHLIRYDCFYHICWTADLFATKFNWMVHRHKLDCFVKKNRLFSRSRSQ